MVQKVPFTSIKASGKIASTGNANIDIEPHGTGDVLIGNFHFDADQSISNSNDNHVLTYDHSGGKISLETFAIFEKIFSFDHFAKDLNSFN